MMKRFVSSKLVPGLMAMMVGGCAVDTPEEVGAAPQAARGVPNLVVTSYTQTCENRTGQPYVHRKVVITNTGTALASFPSAQGYLFRVTNVNCGSTCVSSWEHNGIAVRSGESIVREVWLLSDANCTGWTDHGGSFQAVTDPTGVVVEWREDDNEIVVPNAF